MHGVLLIHSLVIASILVGWLLGRWHLRRPANQDPREDYRRMQRHAAWLEERLDQARREHWGAQMIANLSDQLGDACRQLARSRGGGSGRKVVRRR